MSPASPFPPLSMLDWGSSPCHMSVSSQIPTDCLRPSERPPPRNREPPYPPQHASSAGDYCLCFTDQTLGARVVRDSHRATWSVWGGTQAGAKILGPPVRVCLTSPPSGGQQKGILGHVFGATCSVPAGDLRLRENKSLEGFVTGPRSHS